MNIRTPHVSAFERLRAQSTLADLPGEAQTLVRFQVVNRRRRVLAEFIAERTPDGCGVVTKVPRRFGSLPESLCHAGSQGVPSATPPNILIGIARRTADQWVRIMAPAARVQRLAG